MTTLRRSIDLNADLGEGAGHDHDIMPLISSANIACGGHAGDAGTMATAIALARTHGVAIGAHPGHADRASCGRRILPITPAEAAGLVEEQVAALATLAGDALHHVKLHGGLYHQVGHDERLAEAVAMMLARQWPRLVVYAQAASPLVAVARACGLEVAEEVFADRGYRSNGQLLPRHEPGGCLDDAASAAVQAIGLATLGRVVTNDGHAISVATDTLCVHGDGPHAVMIARAVRRSLDGAGIAVVPPPTGRARPT